jgi:hypothetical protein
MPMRNAPMKDDEMDTIEEIMMNQRMQNLSNSEDSRKQQAAKTPLPPELLRK